MNKRKKVNDNQSKMKLKGIGKLIEAKNNLRLNKMNHEELFIKAVGKV